MKSKWQKLENDCYNYIKELYGNNNLFVAYGKFDPTKADIKVTTAKDTEFFIEVKSSKSQCCQFVLFPNDKAKKFDFSEDNETTITDNCQIIISYMNNHYNNFFKVGKKGIPINIDSSILYGWVKDFYSFKNVKFFVTKGNGYIIFPSEKFSNYFSIEAVYRRKTSGSNEPNEKNNDEEIKQGLYKNDIVGTVEYKSVGGKKRCFLHTNENLKNMKIRFTNYAYQFRENKYSEIMHKKSKYVFEVRRLSNTNNPNVICELTLKQDYQDLLDLQDFEKILND